MREVIKEAVGEDACRRREKPLSLILQLPVNDALAKKFMGRITRSISRYEMQEAIKEAVGDDACSGREKPLQKLVSRCGRSSNKRRGNM